MDAQCTNIFVDSVRTTSYIACVPKRNLPRPTDAELEILRVLWKLGPSTVREVYDELKEDKGVGYTTILKFMQIMTEKGLVSRNEDQRAHLYEAVIPRESTQQQLVDDLLERAFGGSALQLVMQALSSKPATAGEIKEIRRMLDEYEGKKR